MLLFVLAFSLAHALDPTTDPSEETPPAEAPAETSEDAPATEEPAAEPAAEEPAAEPAEESAEPAPVEPPPPAEAPATEAPHEDPPKAPTSPQPKETQKPKVSLSFTNDFEFRYQVMNLEELMGLEYVSGPKATYFEQVNRLVAQGSSGKWTFGTQLDEVAVWAMPYQVDGEKTTAPPALVRACADGDGCLFSPMGDQFYVNPEKFWLRFKGDKVNIELGDFYSSFGFGMALALNRNVEVDIDTSLQGVRFTWSPDSWEFEAIAAQMNRQQVFQDNPNRGIFSDYRHFVGGLRLTRYGLGPGDFTLHSVVYNFADKGGIGGGLEALGTAPDLFVSGVNAQLYGVAGMDWGLEADVFVYPDAEAFTGEAGTVGYTLYGSGTAYIGSTVWLVELRRYKDHQHANYVTGDELYPTIVPPTLEYERSIVNKSGQATLGSNDIWGGRIQTDFNIGELAPYVSFAVFRDEDLDGINQESPVEEVVYNTVLGAEYLSEHWTVQTNGGVRFDDRDGDQYGTDILVHADLALGFPIHKKLHGDLALAARRFWFGATKFGEHENYSELETALTLGFGNKVSLIPSVAYTRNPYAGSKGNLGKDVYGAMEVWIRPNSTWLITTFYGAQQAGLRCSGGQCRQVPSFNGGRVAVTGSF